MAECVEAALLAGVAAAQAAALLGAARRAEAAALLPASALLALLSAGAPRCRVRARLRCRRDASDGWALGCGNPLLLVTGVLLVHCSSAQPQALQMLAIFFWGMVCVTMHPAVLLLTSGLPVPRKAADLCFCAAFFVFSFWLLGIRPAVLVGTFVLCHSAMATFALTRIEHSFTVGEAWTLASALSFLCVHAMVIVSCHTEGAHPAPLLHIQGLCSNWSAPDLASEAVLSGGLLLAAVSAASSLPPQQNSSMRYWRFYLTVVRLPHSPPSRPIRHSATAQHL